MSAPRLTRRALLAGTTALGASLAWRSAHAAPPDQGIGGTGFSLRPAGDEDSDRGIGGTGVIGTIRKFGSIIVNDLRISYPKDVKVRVDGRPATAADLKIGQVVRVAAASGANGALSTRLIDVTSEAVGPVEAVTAHSMTVLGQTVATGELGASRMAPSGKPWAVGDHVAVAGLRRTDGTIVASLIEPAPADLYKVAGPLQRGSDGSSRIGHLALTGVAGAPLGNRLIVEGRPDGGQLAVSKSTSDIASFPDSVKKVSIEAYVVESGNGLRLGSGQSASGRFGADVSTTHSMRVVLTGTKGTDGSLKADGLRSGTKQYRPQRADLPPSDTRVPGQNQLEPHLPTGERGLNDLSLPQRDGGPLYGNVPPGGYYTPPGADGPGPLYPGNGLPPGPGPMGPMGGGGPPPRLGGFGGRR